MHLEMQTTDLRFNLKENVIKSEFIGTLAKQ